MVIIAKRTVELINDNDKAIVATLTAVLAISTIGLWRATIRLWKAGERQMELIKDNAAEQSRDMKASIELARTEFLSSHRPRVILRDVRFIGDRVHYRLVDIGDTSATVIESWIFTELVKDDDCFNPLRSTGYDDLGLLIISGREFK